MTSSKSAFNPCLNETATAILADDREQARVAIALALETDPSDLQAWLMNAWTCDSLQDAEFSLQRALEIAPEHDTAVTGLNWIRALQELAEAQLETSRQLDEKAKVKAAEEARIAEEKVRAEAEHEANQRRAAQAAARLQAEEEARLQAAEEARLQAEEEARLQAEEEARLQAEEEVRLQAEEDARLADDARQQAEEAADAKAAAEEAARQHAAEEARQQAKKAAEAKAAAEEAARQHAAEDARQQAKQEARVAEAERVAEEVCLAEEVGPAETATPLKEATLAVDVNSETQPAPVITEVASEKTLLSADDIIDSVESRVQDAVLALADEVHAEVISTKVESLSENVLETRTTTPPTTQTGNRKTFVLAVDDSPTIRKLVSMTLTAEGFEVVTADDGIGALAVLAERLPDLILSDINMPKLGGYKLCKFVKKHDRTKDIPVVMLSGNDGMFDKMRGKMNGCDGFLSKPFETSELVETVRQFLAVATG